jgi:hypothetical protein
MPDIFLHAANDLGAPEIKRRVLSGEYRLSASESDYLLAFLD